MKYFITTPKANVEFENYTQLVNYLIGNRTKERRWSFPPREDNLLDRVKICEGDQRRAVINYHYWSYSEGSFRVPEYRYVDRDVLILDEFGNNAYNEQLKKDVHTYTYSEDINRQHWKYVNRNNKQTYSRWNLPEVEFRREPVPHTGHRHYHPWRHPHTIKEKRMSCDPEYKEFYRRGRGHHLPSTWDDLYRSDVCSKSWKSCTKNSHQWENKIKINNRHTFVYGPHVDSLYEDEETYNDLE